MLIKFPDRGINRYEESRVVTIRKIEKALNLGNLIGVKRLADFVGCSSVYPSKVFEACEDQRKEMLRNKLMIKLNDPRAK